jgi:hypothetical protein
MRPSVLSFPTSSASCCGERLCPAGLYAWVSVSNDNTTFLSARVTSYLLFALWGWFGFFRTALLVSPVGKRIAAGFAECSDEVANRKPPLV